MGDGEFRIQASALPVTAETVETIMRIGLGHRARPAEHADPGRARGAARRDRARRWSSRSATSCATAPAARSCAAARRGPWPGMRDIIVGRLLAEPVPAPERIAPRRSIAVRLSGSVVQCVNLRAGHARRDPGHGHLGERRRLRLARARSRTATVSCSTRPSSAGSVDAELEIVRRDLARPSRFGGRFADEEDGRAFAAELVAERPRGHARHARRARPRRQLRRRRRVAWPRAATTGRSAPFRHALGTLSGWWAR